MKINLKVVRIGNRQVKRTAPFLLAAGLFLITHTAKATGTVTIDEPTATDRHWNIDVDNTIRAHGTWTFTATNNPEDVLYARVLTSYTFLPDDETHQSTSDTANSGDTANPVTDTQEHEVNTQIDVHPRRPEPSPSTL